MKTKCPVMKYSDTKQEMDTIKALHDADVIQPGFKPLVEDVYRHQIPNYRLSGIMNTNK